MGDPFFTEKLLIFSKLNWRCLFLCQGREGAAEKPEPEGLGFFLLCSAATSVWKKKSNQVRWKAAVSPQLCPASRKPSIPKTKREKADLWVCDCSVQRGVLGSLAEGVRPPSARRNPLLQLRSKENEVCDTAKSRSKSRCQRRCDWVHPQCCGSGCRALREGAPLGSLWPYCPASATRWLFAKCSSWG